MMSAKPRTYMAQDEAYIRHTQEQSVMKALAVALENM